VTSLRSCSPDGAGRWAVRVAALTALVALVASCGSAAKPAAARRPPGSRLTQADALRLSQVLYRDYTGGGAHIFADVPYSSTVNVTITGDVEFGAKEGHLVVQTVTQGEATVTEDIDYTSSEVYEKGGPEVTQELADSGRVGLQWVARATDPTDRPLDKVLAVIVALGSTQRDNPLLIQQSNATWQGTTRIGRVPVDIYRYSASITYYVGDRNGLLYRFVGALTGFAGPVTISLSDRRRYSLPPPPSSLVLTTPGS
jgi:hypothetical protein